MSDCQLRAQQDMMRGGKRCNLQTLFNLDVDVKHSKAILSLVIGIVIVMTQRSCRCSKQESLFRQLP